VSAPRYFQMLVSPHVGGGAKLAMQLHAHTVGARGPISHLLLPGGGEAERNAVSGHYPYTRYRVDRLTGSSRLGSLLENSRLYLRLPRKSGAVVHVHAPFVYGAARPFFSAARARTVLHVHLDFTAEQLSWALSTPPDTVIVCADFMRAAVEQALPAGAATRVRIIRNAIDTRQFEEGQFKVDNRAAAKRELGVDAARPLLMVIANLAPHKGQETAVRAVAALRDLGQDASLWLVGAERSEGQGFLPRLQALVKELRVDDRVTFAGFRNDIPSLLRAADMLLLPSTSEGLPLTILEAQAAGALVLAAPTAGIPEVVEHGRTGFLIAADDVRGYAVQIGELLLRPELMQAISAAARRYVCDHHDLKTYGDQVLGEYERLAPAR
jgi:glycosyltransferase involved in cell wall biosynthesis